MSKKFHVNETDLLCKNRCGFYGNTLWKGYCSVCYKSIYHKKQHSTYHHVPSHHQSQHSSTATGYTQQAAFSRFEEKRKQQSDKKANTVRSIFGRASSGTLSKDLQQDTKNAEHQSQKTPVLHQTERQSQTVRDEFSKFLLSLSLSINTDLVKRVKGFSQKFNGMLSSNAAITVDMMSDVVQDFFQQINDLVSTDQLYAHLEERKVNELMDYLEQYVMNRWYPVTFCPSSSDDEQQDLLLHKRIRSLHWVTIQLLEANINDQDVGVRISLDKAIADIIEMDTKKTPKEKLKCIVNCSKWIFEALKLSKSSNENQVASADDFLPVFIFIILKANPPRLKSNINYITRFSTPSRLNSGEEGYFFTNMCCVVGFIETLNADSLNLTKDQFDVYMSGEDSPDGTSIVYMCDGLRMMHENSEMINRLKQRQLQCMKNMTELEQRITSFRQEFDEKINDLVARTPLQLNARHKADIDEECDIPCSLPQPLIPSQY